MTHEELCRLIGKYLDGTASAEERARLHAWYREQNQEETIWPVHRPEEEEQIKERLLDTLPSPGTGAGQNARSDSRRTVYLSAAAALVLLGCFLIGFFYTKNAGEAGEVKDAAITTISNPSGQIREITLPDSSLVWLNAESKLRFPVAFGSGARRVELEGEAYFEINRDEKRPFRVSAGGQRVQVLGTRFNISAYPDEAGTRTTLLEGSVMIRENHSGKERLLRPGQEATTRDADGIQVADVDTRQAIAWKNGKFVFDEENLEDIMRRIARWYDIEMVYQGDPGGVCLSGSVSRFAEVDDVLRKLELTGMVRFTIEGRRVTARF